MRSVTILLCYFVLSVKLWAEVVPIEEIAKIEDFALQISKEMTPENTLIAFDWDNTITKDDGEDTEFREGEATKNLIVELQSRGFKPLILTNRLKGYGTTKLPESFNSKEEFTEFVKEELIEPMHKMGLELQKNSPFKESEGYLEFQPTDSENYIVIIFDSIVFSGSLEEGGSMKGWGLLSIIDQYLTTHPEVKYILFIDNDLYHLNAVKKAFESRKEKVMLIHYPQ